MKHLRCLLANACYYLGDFWSKVGRVFPDGWANTWLWHVWDWVFYRPYNNLMGWSSDLDGGQCGLWHDVEPKFTDWTNDSQRDHTSGERRE